MGGGERFESFAVYLEADSRKSTKSHLDQHGSTSLRIVSPKRFQITQMYSDSLQSHSQSRSFKRIRSDSLHFASINSDPRSFVLSLIVCSAHLKRLTQSYSNQTHSGSQTIMVPHIHAASPKAVEGHKDMQTFTQLRLDLLRQRDNDNPRGH